MINLSVHEWDLVQMALHNYANTVLFEEHNPHLARELLETKEYIALALIQADLTREEGSHD